MNKKTSAQQLYIIFGVVIALLVGLIGYFAYLLMAPSDQDNQTNTNTNVTATVTNTNTTTNKETKNKKKANANTNTNTNTNTATSTAEGGLVEPGEDEIVEDTEETSEDAATEDEDADKEADNETVVAGEGEQVVTLYFPKTGSDCGEVFPVQRAVTPTEDLYGQLILASMAGPTDEEDGYTTAAGSIRLRRVEYTSAGPTIYVDEAYDDLNTCDQQTTEAQLVETANAMFDLPEGTSGEVIVGYPDDAEEEDTAAEEDTEEETTE